jgi:hypothetical protein
MNAVGALSTQKPAQGTLEGRFVKDLTQTEKNQLTKRLQGIEKQSSLVPGTLLPGTLSLERLMKTHKTVEEILEVIAIYEERIPSENNSFKVDFPAKEGGPHLLKETVSKQKVLPLAASIYEKKAAEELEKADKADKIGSNAQEHTKQAQKYTETATSIQRMQQKGHTWVKSGHAREVSKEKKAGLRDSTAVPAIRVNARQHTITFLNTTSGKPVSCTIDRGAALTNFSDGGKNLEDLKTKGINNPEYKMRRDYLDCLMLQRLQSAVEIEPKGRIADSNQLNILQVSTLTESKKEEKAGTIWDEKNFMKDMAEIFDQFDQKTIYFDNKKAPSVERNEQGEITAIYLFSDSDKDLPTGPVQLRTLFFNYGVQGKIPKENSVQGQINQKGFTKLAEKEKAERQQVMELVRLLRDNFLSSGSNAAPTSPNTKIIFESYLTTLKELNTQLNNQLLTDVIDFMKIEQPVTDKMYQDLFKILSENPVDTEFDRLRKTQESSYDTVTNLLEFAQKHGFSLGVNCASGKDRTGYSIIKFISRLASQNIKSFDKVKSKLQRHLILPHSAALQVAYENINIRVLKLKKIILDGESIIDAIKRLCLAAKAAA